MDLCREDTCQPSRMMSMVANLRRDRHPGGGAAVWGGRVGGLLGGRGLLLPVGLADGGVHLVVEQAHPLDEGRLGAHAPPEGGGGVLGQQKWVGRPPRAKTLEGSAGGLPNSSSTSWSNERREVKGNVIITHRVNQLLKTWRWGLSTLPWQGWFSGQE